jgi:hypothetical protein
LFVWLAAGEKCEDGGWLLDVVIWDHVKFVTLGVEIKSNLCQADKKENVMVQATDHELIPARNASLAAMQSSASGSNVRYYPTWKHSHLKERNEQDCYNA